MPCRRADWLAYGLPAAFFLADVATEPHERWWQQLQRVVDSGRADGELVDAVLGAGAREERTPLVKALARRIQAMTRERRAGVEELLHRCRAAASRRRHAR